MITKPPRPDSRRLHQHGRREQHEDLATAVKGTAPPPSPSSNAPGTHHITDGGQFT